MSAARVATLAAGRTAQAAALEDHRDDPGRKSAAAAGRWPTGAGPITHGTSNTMTGRCRAENDGRACEVCRAGDAARQRAWQARRAQRAQRDSS